MALDFSVLERAPTIAQGFLAGQQAAQQQAEQNRLRDLQMLQMEAQRENILAQRSQREQELRERQAAEAARNALATALAKGGDEAELIKLGPAGIEAAAKLTALNKARGEVFTQRMTAARQFLDTLDPNDPTAPQRYLQWHEANHRDPIIGPMLAARGITADQARSRIEQAVQQGPQALANLIAQSKLGTEKFMEMNKPFAVGGSLYDPTTRTFTQAPIKPTPGETEELVTRLQDPSLTPAARQALQARLNVLTTREPKAEKEPGAPVAVVDEATGKVKLVSREEAIGKTPASAMEGLSPKDIQKREANFPQAKQAVATVSQTMTTIEDTIDRLLQNKAGLNGITGLVYGRTPALTDAARRAESDIKQLRNLAFVQGLTELRAASKTGAGVGNVSNKEGDRFENLKASTETTQSFDDMVASLKRLKAQASATKSNLQTEFEDTYSYRQGRQPTPAPGQTKSGATVSNW